MHEYLPCSLTVPNQMLEPPGGYRSFGKYRIFRVYLMIAACCQGVVKKPRHMAGGDDEHMTFHDRVDLPRSECRGAPERDTLCQDGAEGYGRATLSTPLEYGR